MQKYLLAWTQKSGSHIPSAYASITSGNAGTGTGEYEKACTAGGGAIAGTNDNATGGAGEWIWLSSIGYTTGSFWGRDIRIVGSSGCSSQNSSDSGIRITSNSARFVVRP